MRAELGEYIRRITTVPLPAAPNIPIIDYEACAIGRRPPRFSPCSSLACTESAFPVVEEPCPFSLLWYREGGLTWRS